MHLKNTGTINVFDAYIGIDFMLYNYRYMKVELRNLRYLSGDLDSGNTCPACPKVSRAYYCC